MSSEVEYKHELINSLELIESVPFEGSVLEPIGFLDAHHTAQDRLFLDDVDTSWKDYLYD